VPLLITVKADYRMWQLFPDAGKQITFVQRQGRANLVAIAIITIFF
jgi:hypothetical protein